MMPTQDYDPEYMLLTSYIYTNKKLPLVKPVLLGSLPNGIGERIEKALIRLNFGIDRDVDLEEACLELELEMGVEEIGLDDTGIFKQECYGNAQKVAGLSEEVGVEIWYVEGEFKTASIGIPINHAWNFLPQFDIYFDLTLEIHGIEEFMEGKYHPAIQGSIENLMADGYRLDFVLTDHNLFLQWLNRQEISPDSVWSHLNGRCIAERGTIGHGQE